jgi:hypothetical protein
MTTTATIAELNEALAIINKKYEGNISFREITTKNSRRVQFTLRAVSGKKGARISYSGRNLPCASWHAHGDFFDALFSINPKAVVNSAGKKITINDGNWQDSIVGGGFEDSQMLFSEMSIL